MTFRSIASRVGFPGYQEVYKVCCSCIHLHDYNMTIQRVLHSQINYLTLKSCLPLSLIILYAQSPWPVIPNFSEHSASCSCYVCFRTKIFKILKQKYTYMLIMTSKQILKVL